ncbi:unnamed protein product [Ilex paraguariensis]|uniref:Uncharacterized protein n=1 Tax=Ilex paraguariensis TaxID=185542 RepID=A0ABC8UWM3_9AQUA
MADEAAKSETLAPNVEQMQNSVEAVMELSAQVGTDSSCNNNDNVESSGLISEVDREKSLEYADELMERGSNAAKERDYVEATDCFSRALEIRAAHFGELAPECVNAYYKYGCALLYKAQEEADPLAAVPKKQGESQQESVKDESVKSVINGESSASSNAVPVGSSNPQKGSHADVVSGKDQEEEDEESDAEDLAEADEDESDLDLAWKMLDVARAIVEKHSDDTMEKVEILSTLAEVALEREDIETSLSDYLKALSILEHVVEPDSRHIAELNFRICLCLEIGSEAQDAIPYCQKAISVCKSRVQRLMSDLKSFSGATATSAVPESELSVQHSSSASQLVVSIADKEAEIETLTGLSVELEKKLEDLQQVVSNPKSILSDILGIVSAKAKSAEKSAASVIMSSSQMGTASSSGDFESPSVSTAHTNGAAGVTHLGVVGRGVKRVLMDSGTAVSSAD